MAGMSGARAAGRQRSAAVREKPDARPSDAALMGLALLGMLASWLLRLPCRQLGWNGELPAMGMCFSDPPTLYRTTGMAYGHFPYLSPEALLEYPVLQTLIATATGLLTHLITGATSVHVAQSMYFDVNVLLLAGVWAVTVLLVARMASRPAAAVMAVAPGLIATGVINWDLWPVLTVVAALWAFRGRRWVLGGALLGLGTALKLWPFIVLGAVIVLAIRRRDAAPAIRATAAAAVVWIVLDLPFALADPLQWGYFWGFSGQRGAGFSSIYHVWNTALGPLAGLPPLSGGAVNLLAYGLFAVLCVMILAIGLAARREPRLEELALLIVAAFVLTNKVYSPQFVLWLIPLVLLARPRLRGFLGWQLVEALHWVSISLWLHASSWDTPWVASATGLYVLAVGLHTAALLYLCGAVVLQMQQPVAAPDSEDAGGPGDTGRHAPRPGTAPWPGRAERSGAPAILSADRSARSAPARPPSRTGDPDTEARDDDAGGAGRHG